jgi:hypothetical protein
MKKAILFVGVLFFLLMTIPSYAQKTSEKQKESKTKTEKVLKKESQKDTKLTQKRMEQVNPKLSRLPKLEEVPEKVTHGLIDPITGELINDSGINSADTGTRITSPRSEYRNISFAEIPIVIEGTAKRNSEVKIRIKTTYEKYGQAVTKIMNINPSSDNDGKWGGLKVFSIKVDEADDKATHKITAVRMEEDMEKDNTASVTVYSTPEEITSVKITAPKKNLYPVDEGYEDGKVTAPLTVRGRAIKGHTVEIRVETGQGYQEGSGRLIKDWTPVTVNSQGRWSKQINTGVPKINNGHTKRGEYYLTIFVRDTGKKSDVKTLHLRR